MPHQCTECGRTFADGSKEMLSGCPDCGGNKFQFSPAESPDAGGSAFKETAENGFADAQTGSAPEPGDANQVDADSSSVGRLDSESETSPKAGQDGTSPKAGQDSTAEAGGGDVTHSGSGDVTHSAREDTTPPIDQDDAETVDGDGDAEDRAQASARSDVVSPEELSSAAERTEKQQPPTGRSPSPSGQGHQSPPDGGEASDTGDAGTAPSGPRPGLDSLREELNDQFESIRIVNPGQYELNLMELYDRQEYIISLKEDGRYVIEMPGDWGPKDE